MDTPAEAENVLSIDQLASVVGLSRTRLTRLVHVGIIDPVQADPPTFSGTTAARLQRILRLHHDLGVNLIGAVIIVDLVEKLERVSRTG